MVCISKRISEYRVKFCRGLFEDIDAAIEKGLINSNDIVITSDTHEFVYIHNDGTKEVLGGQIKSYNSRNEALIIINSLASTEAGQIVTILNEEGKYIPYVIQANGSKFTVEPVTAETTFGGVYWTEI